MTLTRHSKLGGRRMQSKSPHLSMEGSSMNRYSLILLLALPVCTFADNPLSNVDPDFAEAFLHDWYDEAPKYSTSKPEQIVNLNLPKQFELVGSKVTKREFLVIYKTKLGHDKAFELITDVMDKDGWTNQDSLLATPNLLFQSHMIPTVGAFCREEPAGLLAISIEQKPDKTYVSFSGKHFLPDSPGTLGIGCDFITPKVTPMVQVLKEYLPKLTLPEDARLTGDGSSFSHNEIRKRTMFSTKSNRDELVDHFAVQMRDQDWVADSNWSGKHAAGSMWTIESSDVGTLIGEVLVSRSVVHGFRMDFVIWPAGQR